ncbi:MAG: insulinase family protein [Oscillospiraceae bacterium]|nr:insulinase family protein [Oscillospiraceae bacterium]
MQKVSYDAIGETLYTGTLSNGLTVYVIPKPGFCKKYAFFATNYGGADRRFLIDGQWRDTPAGIAHFLEHKLFDTETGNALADLAANGAQPNAFTSSELTAYYFECTEGFDENLKTLLSFVSVPYFTEESVQKEQGIIGQEIDMMEDTPDYAVYYNLLRGLYGAHPVRDMIGGTKESIAQITAQTLYDLHGAFYRPSNMVLCVAGDVNPERVLEIAGEILPDACDPVPEKDYGPVDQIPVVRAKTEVTMEVSKPLFLTGTRTPPGARGRACLHQELVGSLAVIYLVGESSPLYLELYNQGLITADFSTHYTCGRGHAFTAFGGESRNPDQVLEKLQAEIRATLMNGIDEDRFNRLKRGVYGTVIKGLDTMEGLCYDQTECHFFGTTALDRLSVLETVTSADMLAFIAENLQPEQFALSIVRPR